MDGEEVAHAFIRILAGVAVIVGGAAWIVFELVLALALGLFALWAVVAGFVLLFG